MKDLKTNFEEEMQRLVESNEIPGMVAMAADRSGVLYSKAWGYRDTGTRQEMTADSVFVIGSLTKAVTAVACMQLVEKGLLDLDLDVGKYVSDFKNPMVIDHYDENDIPILRPAASPITLRHLLSQTAGHAREVFDLKRLKWLHRFSVRSYHEVRRVPLSFDPGTDWAYGCSMDWIGEIIEAVTGEKLGDYFQKHIFAPLNMNSTAYQLTEGMRARLVSAHEKNRFGDLESVSVGNYNAIWYGNYGATQCFGGGGNSGLYGSPADYLRLCQMLNNGGTYKGYQILKPETIREMRQNQIGDVVMEWDAPVADPYPNCSPDFFPGMKTKWGLGFMVNPELSAEGRKPWSMAWWGIYNDYFFVDPDSDLCGLLWTCTIPCGDRASLDRFRQFEMMIRNEYGK